MSKIIEIWRGNSVPGLPVRFAVGTAPMFVGADGGLVAIDGPAVASIAFVGNLDKIHRANCYVVSFVESKIKRVLPMASVVDIAYENQKKDSEVPGLE